jgi:glycosyltransferase involved in cell wall biosynthesis
MLRCWWKKKYRILENVFHSRFRPRVLVSTVNRPFLKGVNGKHNHEIEALEMAGTFHELGYQVDVINYDNAMAIDYARYDVLFGSGMPFENLYLRETARFPRTILYLCGAHLAVSNSASLGRLEAVYRKRGVWLPESARLTPMGIGTERVVDGLIVLGHASNAEPFRAITAHPVHELPLFFYATADADAVMNHRDLATARRHFLWFSGAGLVHKGLDLVLEAFSRHPELHLHVHGALYREPGFLRAFHHELYELPNVHLEGFLALRSPAFRAALQGSAFVICPSCSEANCSSVLNVCGNGGNIPLLTLQCGIKLQDFGILIGDTTVEAVEAALMEACALDAAELDRRQRATAAFMGREHSLEGYHGRLKAAVQTLLN